MTTQPSETRASGYAVLIGLVVATVGTWAADKLLLAPFLIPVFAKSVPWWMTGGVFVLLFIGTAGSILANTGKKKAKREYDACLGDLKHDPNNPDLREKTLKLGRRYSELMRDVHGRTLFDEIALMNDINAACARATVGQNAIGRVLVTNLADVTVPAVPENTVTAQCPTCGTRLTIPAPVTPGARYSCPKCNQRIVLE